MIVIGGNGGGPSEGGGGVEGMVMVGTVVEVVDGTAVVVVPTEGAEVVAGAGRGLRRRDSADEEDQGGERCDPSPDAPPRAVPRVHG